MKRGSWWLLGACVVVGLSTYLVTVKAAASTTAAGANTASAGMAPLCRWLALTPAQQQAVTQDDPTFDADAAALRQSVWAARDTLATMLQAADTPEADVLAQVDRVSAAENALQRRITQYVLRIRQRLTSEQQQNLMGLCANAVRGPGMGMGMGMGRGPMGGMGGGMGGMGPGNGRGFRGGRGPQ
jgi:hypothetical protein